MSPSSSRAKSRKLQIEILEPRLHLSADPTFSFFQTATFDLVPHATESTEVDVADLISLRAARNEIESIPVGLSTDTDTTLRGATFSDLTSSTGDVLSADQLEVRVVHIWDQQGIDRLWEEDVVQVPELLLYDDTQSLSGRFDYSEDASPLIQTPAEDQPETLVMNGKASISFDNHLLLHTSDDQNFAGTVTFEFRPSWNSDLSTVRFLGQLRVDNYNEISLFHNPSADVPGLTAVLETSEVGSSDSTYLSAYGGPVEEETWNEIGMSYQVEPDGAGFFTLSLSLSVDDQTSGIQQKISAAPLAATNMSDFFLGSTSSGGYFAEGAFRNLKFYDQFVADPSDSTQLPTPLFELALDDAEALARAATSLEAGHYVGPRLEQELLLELEAGNPRQLWVTVNVPETTLSGIYTGHLSLDVTNHDDRESLNDMTQILPVTVEVLPFNLLDSDRLHGIYFTVTPQGELPTETITAQLENLTQHGVNALYLQRYFDVDSVAQLLAAVEEQLAPEMVALLADDNFGEDDFIQLVQQYTGTASGYEAVGDDGVEYYIYTIDEPNPSWSCINNNTENPSECVSSNSEPLEKMVSHLERSALIHEAGGQTTTAILFQTQELFADPNSWFYTDVPVGDVGETYTEQGLTAQPVDLPVYHTTELGSMTPPFNKSGDQPLFENIATRAAATDPTLWRASTYPLEEALYYWQSWVQKPALHRTKTGFFLAYSGFRGVAPYTYVCVPPSNDMVYDPFDESLPTGDGDYRRLCTVYPASDGVIDTVGWEAYREGVDDLRYLTTLEQALEDNSANVDETRRTEISEELRERIAAYAAFPYSGETETDLTVNGTQAVQLDADRDFIITSIEELLFAAGDLDRNGDVNADDIDLLYDQIPGTVGPVHSRFDLVADNVIDVQDLEELVFNILGRTLGDANLDGYTDIVDFDTLTFNFDPVGNNPNRGWEEGNLDGDTDIDITDVLKIITNFSPLDGSNSEITEAQKAMSPINISSENSTPTITSWKSFPRTSEVNWRRSAHLSTRKTVISLRPALIDDLFNRTTLGKFPRHADGDSAPINFLVWQG